MYTKSALIFIYTETSLHIGSGTSLSAVDLPVQREKYTNFPTGAGSGIKGAVREWFENSKFVNKETNGSDKPNRKEKVLTVFGPDKDGSEYAGAVSFTDMRLLLFPVRSMKGVFAYITCPFVLNRLKKELVQMNVTVDWNIMRPSKDQAYINETDNEITTQNDISDLLVSNNEIILEDLSIAGVQSKEVNKIAKWLSENALSQSIEYSFWREKIKRSFVVLSDDNFKDFVENSTEIQTRIKLDKATKTTSSADGNLFYEENVPCDSLFYSLVAVTNAHSPKAPDDLKTDKQIFEYISQMNSKRIQIGGDETIGKGLVNIKLLEDQNA